MMEEAWAGPVGTDQSHPQLHRAFKGPLSYLRPCLKNKQVSENQFGHFMEVKGTRKREGLGSWSADWEKPLVVLYKLERTIQGDPGKQLSTVEAILHAQPPCTSTTPVLIVYMAELNGSVGPLTSAWLQFGGRGCLFVFSIHQIYISKFSTPKHLQNELKT